MNSSWELRVEGRLIDEDKRADPSKTKRKFSSFFKSLVIELDKDLYGPDNHLVEWHRTPTTQETDGFQVGECETIAKQRVPWSSHIFMIIYHKVKRPGDVAVRCTILLLLDYQPLQVRYLLFLN